MVPIRSNKGNRGRQEAGKRSARCSNDVAAEQIVRRREARPARPPRKKPMGRRRFCGSDTPKSKNVAHKIKSENRFLQHPCPRSSIDSEAVGPSSQCSSDLWRILSLIGSVLPCIFSTPMAVFEVVIVAHGENRIAQTSFKNSDIHEACSIILQHRPFGT